MKYKIISYDSHRRIHACTDEKGDKHYIDFWVDGTLDKRYKNPESLIGKLIYAQWVHTYEEIAHDVKILK